MCRVCLEGSFSTEPYRLGDSETNNSIVFHLVCAGQVTYLLIAYLLGNKLGVGLLLVDVQIRILGTAHLCRHGNELFAWNRM